MHRRDFLKRGAAAFAAAGIPVHAVQFGDLRKRVGLIGTGWYGKTDLFRLIQVAPVEVVSLCDVDQQDARRRRASRSPTRQASKKKPRTYGDYREMLDEKDLDIVLIATPDHWHALPMIDGASKAGADVYVQKPISVDVVEGQAMLAAARKHKRVVQVGTQRRSTPHLVEARDRVISEGKLGKIGLVEIYCYYHMRARENPPDAQPARRTSTTKCGPARRRCGPTTRWSIRGAGARSWSTATASSATCASTCSTWSAGCSTSAWPARVSSSGGILVDKDSKANITDTQTATFDFGDLRSSGRTAPGGDAARSEVSVGRHVLRRQGHAQGERHELRLRPRGKDEPADPQGRELRARPVPRGQDREGPGAARRARDPRAHEGLPRVHRVAAASRWPTSSRATSRPPPASSRTSRCNSAARSTWDHAKRQGRRGRGSEPAAAPALSRAVGAPGMITRCTRCTWCPRCPGCRCTRTQHPVHSHQRAPSAPRAP